MTCKIEFRHEYWKTTIDVDSICEDVAKSRKHCSNAKILLKEPVVHGDKLTVHNKLEAKKQAGQWEIDSSFSEGGETVGQNSWDGPIVFCISDDGQEEHFLESRDIPPCKNTDSKKADAVPYDQLCKNCMRERIYSSRSEKTQNKEPSSPVVWKQKLAKRFRAIRNNSKGYTSAGLGIKKFPKINTSIKILGKKLNIFRSSASFSLGPPMPKFFTFSNNKQSSATILFRKISRKMALLSRR